MANGNMYITQKQYADDRIADERNREVCDKAVMTELFNIKMALVGVAVLAGINASSVVLHLLGI